MLGGKEEDAEGRGVRREDGLLGMKLALPRRARESALGQRAVQNLSTAVPAALVAYLFLQGVVP